METLIAIAGWCYLFLRKWITIACDYCWYRLLRADYGKPDDDVSDLRVALVCIAKDEDHYIHEWIDYHRQLGVDKVFVYQNDWRASLDPTDYVELIPFDGDNKQLEAYNNFIKNHHQEYDFAIFIDVDEYVCLVKDPDVKTFLSRYKNYRALTLNWRLFGDNGRAGIQEDGYSLLERFTRCERRLNRHVKTILNFSAMSDGQLPTFVNPHFVLESKWHQYSIATDRKSYVHGSYHYRFDYGLAWLNHYRVKTWEEFVGNKQPKGRSDLPRTSSLQREPEKTFKLCNLNEVSNTIARDRYRKVVGV